MDSTAPPRGRGGPVYHPEGWERLDAMPTPDDGMSQVEIAAVVGCSRANINRIERSAIRKLRRWAAGWRD